MGEKTKGNDKKRGIKKKTIISEHKPIVVGGIIVVVAIAGIVTGIVFLSHQKQSGGTFIFGTGGGLQYIDPLINWHFQTNALLGTIAEALFKYEFFEGGYRIVPNLALEGEWSNNNLNYTCYLRQGVRFHDNSPFNATAVKWNFDRLYRLRDYIYWTPWEHTDGTSILNFTETKVVDDYTIRFVLTKPFVPFEAILGQGPRIVSPKSTPFNNFTEFDTGKLIGTGPFKYDSTLRIYDPDLHYYISLNSTFLANEDYWDKDRPIFDKIYIKVFDNSTLKKEEMISGDIHFTEAYPFHPSEFENIDGITFLNDTGLEVAQITMNNSVINVTIRKAISYALDYEQLVPLGTHFTGGTLVLERPRSPLSKGMLYSNWEDFNIPELNITKARQVLIDANWPGTAGLTADANVSTGNEWEKLIDDGNPLAIFNFSYYASQDWHRDMAYIFHNNLTQIGIKVNAIPNTWPGHWSTLGKHQFLIYGWQPDYNDPNSSIYPLFSNSSTGNYANVNDPYLQTLMDNAIIEFNETARQQLYIEIQEYIIEDLYPVIWWYSPMFKYPISTKLSGYNQLNNWGIPWDEWYFN